MPEELQNIQVNVDLITKKDHTSRERADFVLDSLSLEIAREWFQEEFGVTFNEGIRPMIVHVVRRRGREQNML